MPIITIHNLDKQRAWGLWNIQEETKTLEDSYSFGSEERMYLDSISHLKKK